MNTQDCNKEIRKYTWLSQGTNLSPEEVAQLIQKYVETHKWLINEKIPFEISFEQAVFSWHENVYQPLVRALFRSQLFDIYQKQGKNLFEAIQCVSDAHYYANENQDIGSSGVGYEEVCFRLLFSIKGFWLQKIRALLLGK